MNKHAKTGLIAALILSVVSISYIVYALTLIESYNVLSCTETDAGFDFITQGMNWGVLNDTNMTAFNVTDFCIDNNTVGEYVCGSTYGPQYSNLAALYSENCTQLCLNNQSVQNCTGQCVSGACV